MHLRLALLAASLIAVALWAAPASATNYCVHKTTACPPGTDSDTGANLQGALGDAAASPSADVIHIGPGEYTGPFDYAGASALDIAGAGADATTLKAAAGPFDTVLNAAAANVHDLHVRVPVSDSWTGISVDGTGMVSDVL